LANAPPPLKLLMQEKTLPFAAPVVEYWLSPNGNFVRSTAVVSVGAALELDVAVGFLASLLHAATTPSALMSEMTMTIRRTGER
jgi:hypothetical protein